MNNELIITINRGLCSGLDLRDRDLSLEFYQFTKLISITLTFLLKIAEIQVCEHQVPLLLHSEAVVFDDFPCEHDPLYIKQ